jgi:eukaryotic-like serine/threonine-protein kinase
MSLAAGSRLGPYEIAAPIGAGGMGEVYKARDTRLDRSVAIKVLPPEFSADADRRARFEREAKAIAALNHPHICTLHDVGDTPSTASGQPTLFLVMEHVAGETLAQRLEKGPMPLEQTLGVAAEIADALAAAHRQGVIHRDLKPGNVMLTKGGTKLLDFGLAKLRAGGGSPGAAAMTSLPTQPPATGVGTILGTVPYMSPEQLEGRDCDPRSDIFAFGCVLFEMLTGGRAFPGRSEAMVISAIMSGERPSLGALGSAVPPALRRLVQKCLAREPDDRWQHAADVVEELRGIAADLLETGSTAAAEPARPAARGRRRAWVAAAALVLIAGAALAWSIVGRASSAWTTPVFVRKTFRPQTVFRASFGRDGETVFVSAALQGNVPELFEIRPGEPNPRPLGLPGAHLLSVSVKDELAILTKVRYIRHRLFSGTLAIVSPGTEPRELPDDVREADWSPDGESLALIRIVDGKDRLEFPHSKVLYEEPGGYLSDVRVSPTGRHVAFVQHDARYNDSGRIFIVETATGRRVSPPTKQYESVEGMSWLPDGGEVLFAAADTGADQRVIRSVDLAGHEGVVLTAPGALILEDVSPTGRLIITRDTVYYGMHTRAPGATEERDAGWHGGSVPMGLSADGRLLLFVEQNLDPYTVCVRGTAGSGVKALGATTARATLSPDGREALATIDDSTTIVIYPTGIGTRRKIPGGRLAKIRSASWFPEGNRILACGYESGKRPGCYVDDGPAGGWRQVTRNGTTGLVAPDGRRVVVLDPLNGSSIYPLDGSLISQPIPGISVSDIPVAWSADGGAIYFLDALAFPGRICRVDLATGKREVRYTFQLADLSGVIQWMGAMMARDADAYAYGYFRQLSDLYIVERANPAARHSWFEDLKARVSTGR